MRLLNTSTLELTNHDHCDFEDDSDGNSRPKYAVLSHRWAQDPQSEVTFADMNSGRARDKPGFSKVQKACQAALQDELEWIWIDTCCIDKSSSAELTQSINSMFTWYKHAECCYAYLYDVSGGENSRDLGQSEWFERGWTLQELIAPPVLKFYDANWHFLGTRNDRALEISDTTGIHLRALRNEDLKTYTVAQKMSWAARRKTSIGEDASYCLLGIFGVNLAPIYGEGR